MTYSSAYAHKGCPYVFKPSFQGRSGSNFWRCPGAGSPILQKPWKYNSPPSRKACVFPISGRHDLAESTRPSS